MPEIQLNLYLTRHGQSWGNVRASGEGMPHIAPELLTDSPLTDLGEQQARLLGERLAGLQFDAIYSSPLYRALQTAHETALRQPDGAVPIQLIADLVETGTLPPPDGWDTEKLRDCHPALEWCAEAPAFGVQKNADGEEAELARLLRARRILAFLRERHRSGESILLCAHGTFNTYLLRAALGLPNENGFNFCQENTNLNKIKYYENGKVRLSYMNDTTHLVGIAPEITFTL